MPGVARKCFSNPQKHPPAKMARSVLLLGVGLNFVEARVIFVDGFSSFD